MRAALFTAAVAALVAVAGPARAEGPAPDTGAGPPGTWRFQHADRPVKAVLVGGLVAAWKRGGFGHFLEAACPRLEVVNRSKARLGAGALRERFVRQVLKNRRVDPAAHEATWLIFHGGLNSIGTPRRTNRHVAEALLAASRNGLKTMVISLAPWGDAGDRRWRGARGLRYLALTRLAVDFVMGRLDASEAFDRPPANAPDGVMPSGALPDVAVDLYASDLRDPEAPLLDEERTRRYVARDRDVRRQLARLPEAERPAALEAMVREARELPRWFMREDLRAFDHIHPNLEGHRAIARAACKRVPTSWGCDCAAIERMTWSRKDRGLVPRVQSASVGR